MGLRNLIGLSVIVSGLLYPGHSSRGMLVAQEPDPGEGALVERTARFELRSEARVALHHLLIDWAAADAGEWPPYAPTLEERETWRSDLDAEERGVWARATEAYASSVGRSLLFDRGLLAVRDWAAGTAPRHAIPEDDLGLALALEAALPVYRRHWWGAHDALNRGWIASVAPMLRRIEDDMIPRLEAAYGGRWPEAPVAVDVVVYANPVGAYSTGGRVTIASGDTENRMPQALELVFHEASHMDPLEVPLRNGIREAFDAAGGEAPARLWHDVIFYTAGEITRLVLAEHGQPDYQHYGERGVYTRGERWPPELAAFDRHWKPFLHSGSDEPDERRAALGATARQLAGGGVDSQP